MRLSVVKNNFSHLYSQSLERLLNEASTCPTCLRWGGSPFCQPCWQTYKAKANVCAAPVGLPFKVLRLFEWNDGAQGWVGDLVHGLKGGYRNQTFKDLAWLFAMQFLSENKSVPSNAVIVPSPSRYGASQHDHAYVWAEHLANIFNVEFCSALAREYTPEDKPQKQKSGFERRQVQLRAKISFVNRPIIFVDDVVTTGATAQAAFKAFKPLNGFETWCIAYRAKQACP